MVRQGMMKEIEHEGAETKKMLERVPFDKFNWKPHEKSKTLGELATHVAEIPRWTSRILTSTDFTAGGYKPTEVKSTDDLVKLSETLVQKAIADLQAASDEDMMTLWSLKFGEHVVFTLPRVAAIRAMSISHMIHHRGQLSVYLRLLDIPVPGMYGPSADERR